MLLVISFVVFMLLGLPLFGVIGLASIISMIGMPFPMEFIPQNLYTGMDQFPLIATIGFVMAGFLMEPAGITGEIIEVAKKAVGNIRGGLAMVTILACMIFAALSGSGPATTAAIGSIMIPGMIAAGYRKDDAAAVSATGGTLGILIPPSNPMIIYGVVANTSIAGLFMAGFIPGFVLTSLMCITAYCIAKKRGYQGTNEKFSIVGLCKAIWDGKWALATPAIILGGIYAGIFTPTEAAVVAIFYTILVGIFIHKELTLKSFMASLKTTSWLTGRVLVLVFTATAFGYLLTSYRIPVEIANWILSFTNNVNLVWFFVVILLLFLGMFMETLAIIMLVTPVLLPIMTAYGVDPIHFGIILICCCGIGFSTPPLGENMFIASGIANVSLEEISLKALPLVAINIAVIAILVMFPDIVLFLPNLMGTGLQ